MLSVSAIVLWAIASSGQIDFVPPDRVEKVAERCAQSLLGDVYSSEPVAYYSRNDELTGHRFTYSIDSPFPEKSRLMGEYEKYYEQGNHEARWGIDRYGSMFTSAHKDVSAVQDHTNALSPEYSMGFSLDALAEEKPAGSVQPGNGTKSAKTPGTWKGEVSTDWHDPANWSEATVPTSTVDVTIPSGTPYQPIIEGTAYCHDITIGSGAVLKLANLESLSVYGDFNSDAGQFIMMGNYSFLTFRGSEDNYWDDDNENDTYTYVSVGKDIPTARTTMWQNMDVDGVFNVHYGEFAIDGNWTLQVHAYWSQYGFIVEDGGTLILDAANEAITSYGEVHFFDGSQAIITNGTINCMEDFVVDANATYDIVFTGGTLRMNGTSTQYINDSDGGALDLYNLVIDKTGGTCYIESANMDVNGSLTISAGTLSCDNGPSPTVTYNIYLEGDWTNNVGDAGFGESTGKVIFDGAGAADITTSETFHNVDVDKTYAPFDGLEFAAGITVNVLGNLRILDGTIEMNANSVLNLAHNLVISLDAGLNANDGGIELNIGGNWTNNNTGYNTIYGYTPGNETVTFNGSALQTLNTAAAVEDFGNVKVNKPAGNFRPNDNMATMGSLEIMDGLWSDLAAGLTHYILGDFTIQVGGGYTSQGTTVFKGTGDQSYTRNGGTASFQHVTVDKTAYDKGKDFTMTGGEAVGKEPDNEGSKAQTVTLNSNLVLVNGGNLVIDYGTLDMNHNNLKVTGTININDDGTLQVDDGAELSVVTGLYVNNLGTLQTWGAAGNNARVYKDVVGQFDFEINSGGTISSEYTVFEDMSANGIYIKTGALVDAVYSFNHCTFQNGAAAPSSLLVIHNAQDFTVEGAIFPTNTWGGGYNVWKAVNTGHVLFNNATGGFAGPMHEYDPNNRIDWAGTPGLWTGAANNNWFEEGNWSDFTVPVAATWVMIPSACPFYPVISGMPAVCKNITIASGASLEIGNNSLTVGGSALGSYVDINGQLTMTNAAGVLNASSVNWNAGSTDNVTAGEIHVNYHHFWDGTDAKLGTGNTVFVSLYIMNYDADAEYGNLTFVPPDKGSFEAKANYPVKIAGNFTITTGFNAFFSLNIYIGGTFDIQSGASFTLDTPDTVEVTNTFFTLNGNLDLGTGHLLCHNGFELASTGTLTIDGGSLIMDKAYYAMDAGQYFYGTLNMTGGLLEMTHNSFRFESPAMVNISGGILRCGFSFNVIDPNIFQPTGGVVEFTGNDPGCGIYCTTGNYFNNLYVNRGSAIGLYNDLVVKGNVEIAAGPLSTIDISLNQYNITIGGNWTNTGGSAAFDEGTGTVFFNGNGPVQNVSAETFYNVQQDYVAPGSDLQFMGATTISNNFVVNHSAFVNSTFDVLGTLDLGNMTGVFTANTGGNATIASLVQGGTVVGNGGTITVNDLAESGIFGTYNVNAGAINLNQDLAQYADLDGTLNVTGGAFKMTGGSGSGSWWSYGGNASVTLSGTGVIDFVNNGINAYQSPTYTLTENITGGTIRTNWSFIANNASFTPSGGVSELYGGTDAVTWATDGAAFYNVVINKSGGDGSMFQYEDREGNLAEGSKANIITLGDVLNVSNDLTVDEGKISTAGYDALISGNVTINGGGTLTVDAGSNLALGSGKSLTVNSLGALQVLGISGTWATVTHLAGYYAFNVESGGNVAAEYGNFQYMNTNGIFIKSGATVGPPNFDHCRFRDGQSGGELLRVHNNQVFDVTGALFPNNTWGGSYNVYKIVNAGTVNFINATGLFAGPAFEYDPNNRINWTTTGFLVDVKVYCQGPYNAGTGFMNTSINTLLPLTHPFQPTLPYFGNPMPDWYYTGPESVAAIPNLAIVDWIMLELRDAPGAAAATPSTVVARQACFLRRNGKVADLNGANPVDFDVPVTQGLFVVLWQRNHLGVMSSVPLTKVDDTYSYDFSTAAGQAYLGGQKEIATGVWGMFSGDGNGDGQVGNPDKLDVWTVQSGSAGYKEGDFDLSGQVNNVDKVDFWKPNSGSGSQIPM
jgi:hypothetical protein